MEAAPIDLVRREHANDDSLGAADDRAVELVAPVGRHLLRVVQERERPDAVVAQARVVEQHSGDDERTGERAAAGLVRSRDEARPEPAVEPEQLLAGAAHAPTIARPAVGTCDESVQFGHALGRTPVGNCRDLVESAGRETRQLRLGADAARSRLRSAPSRAPRLASGLRLRLLSQRHRLGAPAPLRTRSCRTSRTRAFLPTRPRR